MDPGAKHIVGRDIKGTGLVKDRIGFHSPL